MKKCPFCKADIEDNARFCLYCMKTLNEKVAIQSQKKRRWLPVVAGLLVIALLAGGWLILKEPEDTLAQTPVGESEDVCKTTDAPVAEATAEAVQETESQETESQETESQETEQQEAEQQETERQETEQPKEPETEAVYTYRAAQAGDEFYANYTNIDGDIVITGIAQAVEDGIYDIPAYIDGKRVIAIVANAFTNSNAQCVYVPETVRSIWNYAFAGCGLTDIFFRGDSIYTESKAFPEGVTIHCSADCSDRSFRYYKDCAEDYGATWEEWNG